MKNAGTLLLLASLAFAGPAPVVKETAAHISRAIEAGNFISLRTGISRSMNLRDRYGDKAFEPIVKALGAGTEHKDKQIAKAVIVALGKLKNRGSSRFLTSYLKPGTVYLEDLPLYLAAIEAAGSIHDPERLPAIERLLTHKQTKIAVAGAAALLPYRTLDRKPRLAMIRRLADALAKLEKAQEKATEEKKKLHYGLVRAALRDTLRVMTYRKRLETSEHVKKWLKEELSS